VPVVAAAATLFTVTVVSEALLNVGSDVLTVRVLHAVFDVTLPGITVNVTPSEQNISRLGTAGFEVNFTVPETASLGIHTGTYKAYVENYENTWYDTKTFNLTVLATEDKKIEINQTFDNYTLSYNNLSSVFQSLRSTGMLTPENITELESLFNESNQTITQIISAIGSDDYITASALLSDLSTQLDNIEYKIGRMGLDAGSAANEFWSGVWIWVVIIIVVIGVIILLVYMLLPPSEGYHVGHGYKSKGKGGIFGKMKEKFSKASTKANIDKITDGIKDKTNSISIKMEKPPEISKDYAGGYERSSNSGYSYGSGGPSFSIAAGNIKKKLGSN